MTVPFASEHFWVIAFASALVGMSKGGLPIVAMLSVPLLSFFIPTPLAAGLLLPIYLVSDVYGLILYRRDFSRDNIYFLFPISLVGIVIGYFIIRYVDAIYSTLLVALIGIVYLAYEALAREREAHTPSRPIGYILGVLTGLTSYISHSGGPPYQAYILPQKLPKMVFAGTSTILFAMINFAKLPFYALAGQLDFHISNLIWLAPFALVGVWLGFRLTRILPERLFYIFVRIALAAVSVALLIEAINTLRT